MAYKILSANLEPRGYVVKVHLDDTKFTQWDEPDPEYVREWTWGMEPPAKAIHDADGNFIPEEKREFHSEAEYMQLIKIMIAEHVRSDLAAMGQATALPGSGRSVEALLKEVN